MATATAAAACHRQRRRAAAATARRRATTTRTARASTRTRRRARCSRAVGAARATMSTLTTRLGWCCRRVVFVHCFFLCVSCPSAKDVVMAVGGPWKSELLYLCVLTRLRPGLQGYREDALGTACLCLHAATSLSLIAALITCVVDYYVDCQCTGIDNLCFYGSYPLFGGYQQNAVVRGWCGYLVITWHDITSAEVPKERVSNLRTTQRTKLALGSRAPSRTGSSRFSFGFGAPRSSGSARRWRSGRASCATSSAPSARSQRRRRCASGSPTPRSVYS